mmetsp:Transcript_22786/g.78005  ORF Transcript_22786/g.78005 Transcript_22786/m.78005 type:complete len:193 (+) Transcript_22786:97-675(+)
MVPGATRRLARGAAALRAEIESLDASISRLQIQRAALFEALEDAEATLRDGVQFARGDDDCVASSARDDDDCVASSARDDDDCSTGASSVCDLTGAHDDADDDASAHTVDDDDDDVCDLTATTPLARRRRPSSLGDVSPSDADDAPAPPAAQSHARSAAAPMLADGPLAGRLDAFIKSGWAPLTLLARRRAL